MASYAFIITTFYPVSRRSCTETVQAEEVRKLQSKLKYAQWGASRFMSRYNKIGEHRRELYMYLARRNLGT